MKVKVEFVAKAYKTSQGWVEVEMPNYTNGAPSGRTVLLPVSVCTPILPDFAEGDLVEHEPSGARGRAVNFANHLTPVIADNLLVEMYSIAGLGSVRVQWPAADCTIVKKAGE